MPPRFLLDEHVDRVIQRQLRRIDPRIEVLAVGDALAPPTGTDDPDLLIWAEEHGYLFITEDRATMPNHLADHFAAGRSIAGLFWLRPFTPLGRIVDELYLIWSVSTADEFVDRAFFIPL